MRFSFIFLAIFFLCCLSSFLIFDSILRIQYKNHYSEWEEDGKPFGFFFRPKEINYFGSCIAMQSRCLALTFVTPAWSLNEPKVLKLIFWYRILGVFSLLVWLAFGYTVIYQL